MRNTKTNKTKLVQTELILVFTFAINEIYSLTTPFTIKTDVFFFCNCLISFPKILSAVKRLNIQKQEKN